MDVIFNDGDLDRLEVDATFTGNWNQNIVKAYWKRLQMIRAAPDERDFYALKSLKFERLKGKRKNQHSMRLNDQYRLVLELQKGNRKEKSVLIVGIEDYH